LSVTRALSAFRSRILQKMGVQRFAWSAAQQYEQQHSERWIQENFETLFARIEAARRAREISCGSLLVSEFFSNDDGRWLEFARNVQDKTCLEVGAGPCGELAHWWWLKHRFVIDPLAAEYKRVSLQLFQRTWYTDDMRLYSQPAERVIDELRGAIDGAIVCRNTLDHCDNPFLVLSNIAAYAKPGCQLLLWTDLWHPSGHDAGHRNIIREKKAFEQQLNALGFDILYSFEDRERPTINYGCRAKKRIIPNL